MFKNLIRYLFLFLGLVDSIALIFALYLSLEVIVFYFSYFTILSNILITSLFIYIGLVNPKKLSNKIFWLYGAAVLYMAITGIIYWGILVNAKSLSLDPWINLTLHGGMPIAAFLSWIFSDWKNKLSYNTALEWLILPVIFVFYTLIHGSIVNWYPYPFLSPLGSGGYGHVLINVLSILFGAWIIGLMLIGIKKWTK